MVCILVLFIECYLLGLYLALKQSLTNSGWHPIKICNHQDPDLALWRYMGYFHIQSPAHLSPVPNSGGGLKLVILHF